MKAPSVRLRKEKAAAEMYKVKYPDASDCEFHTLAAAEVLWSERWQLLGVSTAAAAAYGRFLLKGFDHMRRFKFLGEHSEL